ncbi:hypothetical protein [Streptomyces sp. NPDC026659]|uniref:hypothetical protein n=1 Tax=Streptomyces sp. NPDC026659 TaxID=3155123 RepID=UPI0033DCAC00
MTGVPDEHGAREEPYARSARFLRPRSPDAGGASEAAASRAWSGDGAVRRLGDIARGCSTAH